jgi:hypothetical protein
MTSAKIYCLTRGVESSTAAPAERRCSSGKPIMALHGGHMGARGINRCLVRAVLDILRSYGSPHKIPIEASLA